MIREIKQNITEIDTGVIVHGVNCQGVMGSGVAGAIRKKWPKVFGEYFKFCSENKLLLGKINPVQIDENLWVINLFSQFYYGNDSIRYADLAAINIGMEQCILFAYDKHLPLYTVPIGCGLGGLSYENEIKPLFIELSEGLEIIVCDI